MKILFTLGFLCACVVGFTQKTYTIKYSTGITVDGNLSDWDLIPFTDDYVKLSDGSVGTQVTKAKIA